MHLMMIHVIWMVTLTTVMMIQSVNQNFIILSILRTTIVVMKKMMMITTITTTSTIITTSNTATTHIRSQLYNLLTQFGLSFTQSLRCLFNRLFIPNIVPLIIGGVLFQEPSILFSNRRHNTTTDLQFLRL